MDKEFFNGMNLAEDISEEDFQYIKDGWEKVQDALSKDEFIDKFNKIKEEYKDASFFSDKDFIDMVVNPFTGEETKGETVADFDVGTPKTIAEVEPGRQGFSVIARVMSISNPKLFTSRKGEDGKLANMQIADNTGEVRLVLWTENIKHLKHISEGDIVEISDVDCKDGFRGGKEFSLRPRSLLRTIDETSENYPENIADFPVYEENIISIADIVPDEKVSIFGRLIRVPAPHSYESNGKKGKVTSLEIQDKTGKIAYTLWNKDVKLIDSLDLKEGDIVKILNEQSRERNGEISLSHWDGRILKVEGDYDIPEYEENIIKIGNAQEINDVTLIGIVTKIQDTIQFDRQDGTKGFVKSIEITDDTGSIRVTLWGDDTKLKVTKEVKEIFEKENFSIPTATLSFEQLLSRPEITISFLEQFQTFPYQPEIKEQVEIYLKYKGYIEKSYKEAEKLIKLEKKQIPEDIDYDKVSNIASEARQKLKEVRPTTIAQAIRISGVNPSDISILSVYLKKEYGKDE